MDINPALTDGLHCKACDGNIDPVVDIELCPTCMEVVIEYNSDLCQDADSAGPIKDYENEREEADDTGY